MAARNHRFFRSPRTTNEKRRNAAFAAERFAAGVSVRGRIRSEKTSSRLVDIRDDRVPVAGLDRARGKASHSLARKAAERARWRG